MAVAIFMPLPVGWVGDSAAGNDNAFGVFSIMRHSKLETCQLLETQKPALQLRHLI